MSGPLSTFNQRVDWFIANESLWKTWPTATNDMDIIRKMQHAGLVSSNTACKYVDIGKLVSAARRKIRGQKSKSK
jgi:hypothetical protein